MINLGFILLPLYIYPNPLNLWAPFFDCAKTYPDLSFLVVINPDSGPGKGPCPDSVYTAAIHTLNGYSNIVALGYVHTSYASRPQADLQADIDKYQGWSNPTGCSSSGSQSIGVDGIFFDEAPSKAPDVPYMQKISAYARKKLTNGKTIVYNPAATVDPGYWEYADFINIFEDTEAVYRQTKIPARVGIHANNATVLIHTYTSDLKTEKDDVDTIIDTDKYGLAGVEITELTMPDPWRAFPAKWASLCKYVDAAK